MGSYKVTCSGAGGSAVYSAASDCTSAGEIPPGGFTSGRCYTAPGAAVAPAAQSFAITCGEGGLSSASFAPVASSSGAPASAALAGAAALALAAAAAALALRVGRA